MYFFLSSISKYILYVYENKHEEGVPLAVAAKATTKPIPPSPPGEFPLYPRNPLINYVKTALAYFGLFPLT